MKPRTEPQYLQLDRYLHQSKIAFLESQKRISKVLALQAEHPGKIEFIHDQVLVSEDSSPELVQAVLQAMFGKIE